MLDRRRLLLAMEVAGTLLTAAFALLVRFQRVTPLTLLAFILVAGVAEALATPAWQAIVPQLVPRQELAPAVALNGVGINISRAIGPALAGLIIVNLGVAAPFWLNAVSISALSARCCGGAKRAARARCCRPSVSARRCSPAFAMRGTIFPCAAR